MEKFKFIQVDQNTDEWLNLRVGKVTSSSLGKIMANYGKAFGEPAKKYAIELAFERVYTKYSESSGFQNHHTQRGHEQEPRARAQYEEQYFTQVDDGGFFDCGDFGCSPDGIVEGGVIEIKSQIPSVHFATVKTQSFPSSYRWQVAANCHFTNSKFIDCISYCDDVPDSKCLYVRRYYSDELEDDYKKIKMRMAEFLENQVSPLVEMINNSNYSVNV